MNLGTARSLVHRALFAALGAISVVLAFVGVFVPRLPKPAWIDQPRPGTVTCLASAALFSENGVARAVAEHSIACSSRFKVLRNNAE